MTPTEQVKEWARAYYLGNPTVSDEEYDAFCKANNIEPGLQADELSDDEPKEKHIIHTGTLAKLADEAALDEWLAKKAKSGYYNLSYKIDGSGMELQFVEGKLVKAVTRGNGVEGIDRTNSVRIAYDNSRVTNTLVTKDGKPFTGAIRCEMAVTKANFEKRFKSRYANARNLVAGIILRKFKDLNDEQKEDLKYVTCIAYDAYCEDDFVTQTELMSFLVGNGFVTPYCQTVKLNELRETAVKMRNDVRNQFVDCDGIVIKADTIDRKDRQLHTPKNDIALKPDLECATTLLKEIEWSIAGRYVTPIGIIEPVQLEGTTVSRVNMANLNVMRGKGNMKPGDTILIKKHGQIIPYAESVVVDGGIPFEIIDKCPVCGSPLVESDNGFLECVNESCGQKVVHMLDKFFTKLDIKNAGTAFIEAAAKDVKTLNDLLNSDKINYVKWAGGKNGEKAFANMKKAIAEPISYAKYLSLFDFQGVGERRMDAIEDLIPQFINGKNPTINVEGWEELTINKFKKEFDKKLMDIKECMKFFKFGKAEVEASSNKLEGKSFCFTGKAEAIPGGRKACEALVVANGGTVSSVKKGLSYLVTDDTESGSSKNVKAKELGIPVITSFEFKEMVN